MTTMEEVKQFLDDRKAEGIGTKVGDVMDHFNIGVDEAKKLAIEAGAKIVRERIPYMVGPNPKKIYFE
ncbi:hypothetical protein [Methanococcus maripaludis]|uniref:Uncharacterized protein n=1 Tax=Methanococcus maripaludis TaxID=39152 RepID=A0A8T4H2P8_METMI|nr:hypothetical protein [Methanococcus maripaludis]MBM7408751.1 hypothetical protein [Methanococcus maripaludis]MBP2219080.1 hypothetical protein [Methanococcus maripaludis]